MNGVGENLYLLMSGEMNRAMTSAPPPVPAGIINSTGLVGSHACAVPIEMLIRTREKNTAAAILHTKNRFFIQHLLFLIGKLFNFPSQYLEAL
jgi:hypothetical protein